MTPGLAGPPFPEKAKKGAPVAIAAYEKPSVPVAVGTCLIDVSALKSVQGARGHAVQTVHWAGDEIWGYSTSGKQGGKTPDDLPEWLAKSGNVSELAESVGDLKLDDDEEGGVSLAAGTTTPAGKERDDAMESGKDDMTKEEVLDQADVPKMNTKGKSQRIFWSRNMH